MYKNLTRPSPTTGQPYKFGGKELITANGLNEYDFGARCYYQAIPGFTSIDPLCEDAKHLSPYLYCGNNPVNSINPDRSMVPNWKREGVSTKNAEKYGWEKGNAVYRQNKRK